MLQYCVLLLKESSEYSEMSLPSPDRLTFGDFLFLKVIYNSGSSSHEKVMAFAASQKQIK